MKRGGSLVHAVLLHTGLNLYGNSLYDKEAEFRTWLVEERKLNPETLSKDLTKKEFARFVEDYNTGEYPY